MNIVSHFSPIFADLFSFYFSVFDEKCFMYEIADRDLCFPGCDQSWQQGALAGVRLRKSGG